MKFYRGAPKAARTYLERDCARYDDYYLAEGDGIAIRLVAQPTESGAAVETKQEMDGDTYEQSPLAIIRSSGRVSVGMLRAWGVSDTDARRATRDLVTRGVAVRTGGKRYASYRLAEEVDQLALPGLEIPVAAAAPREGIEAELDVIVQAIRAGHATSRGMAEHLGRGYQTVLRRLRELEDRGIVAPTRPKRSSKQSYRIVGE
ncbi:hypothetical protein [Nocardioides ochotonae]|uniref:hypothetical protein n=1 Tax=Nocardioides ochotonae TaxID=2685869 RepID=UPI0014085FD9|nr:hypothetical protein [Nocardioides ochotonae]